MNIKHLEFPRGYIVNKEVSPIRRPTYIAVVIALLVTSISCAAAKPQPKSQLKTVPLTKAEQNQINVVIMNYNNGLVAALEKLDSKSIKVFTTPNQLKKDEIYIDDLKKAKIRVVNTLLAFKVIKSSKIGNTSTVETEEVWRVIEQGANGRKKDNGEVYYKVTYILVKNNNKWLIDSVEAEMMEK